MPEINLNNPEARPGQSPEELAALEQARQQLKREAGEFLNAQELVPQAQERNFQVHPDSAHAEQVEQIVGKPKAEVEMHQEVPGMPPMPANIKSEDERRKFLSQLIETKHPIEKPGAAHKLQQQFDQLYSPDELKAA